MSSKSLSNHFLGLLAQATDADPVSEEPIPVETVPPAINIAIANRNRLGPYSVFLKDAFEAGQADQFLQVIDSDRESSETPIDILALGRSLTPGEKAQGFEQQLITREKIAFIVSPDNTFDGTLTIQQLAGIFDGSITNWSEVGGDDLPIRVINRPLENDVRRSLSDYASFKSAQWELNAVKPATDSTADIMAELGSDGISYAPANETLEQFSTRILTIDNVGVDDGRYPFSLPLYYVYESPVNEKVQSFLNFVQTPDAQSAVEFAQSQPADPTRSYVKPLLGELRGDGDAPVIEEAVEPESSTPVETVAPSVSPTPEPSPLSPKLQVELWNWLPLLFVFLVLAFLGWLAMMRVKLEKQRKYVPRPAPDYAKRLKAQGSNRNPEDLKAIATKFKEKTDAERAERQAQLEQRKKEKLELNPDKTLDSAETPKPVTPIDLDLDWTDDEPTPASLNDEGQGANGELDPSFEDEYDPLWDEDQTTLQVAPVPEIAIDEDMTVLQVAPQAGPVSTPSPVIEEFVEDDEDLTVLQGVFDSPIEDTGSSDEHGVPSSPLDPLTGIEQEPKKDDVSDDDWSTLSDPWEEPS